MAKLHSRPGELFDHKLICVCSGGGGGTPESTSLSVACSSFFILPYHTGIFSVMYEERCS